MILSLAHGVDFLGFRNFYHFKLFRERDIRKMARKIEAYSQALLDQKEFKEIFQGWQTYAKWANTYHLRKNLAQCV